MVHWPLMRKLIRQYRERQYAKLSHRLDALISLENQAILETEGQFTPLVQRVAEKRARVATKRHRVAQTLKETP